MSKRIAQHHSRSAKSISRKTALAVILLTCCTSLSLLFYRASIINLDGQTGLQAILLFLSSTFQGANDLLVVLVTAACWLFCRDFTHRRLSPTCWVPGLLGGAVTVLGQNFLKNGSFSYLFRNGVPALLFSFAAFVGYTVLYTGVFSHLFGFFDRDTEPPRRRESVLDLLFEKRPFLSCSGVILLCWLPFLILYFPGIVHYDTIYALDQYYGFFSWDTRFPPVSVLMAGYTMDVGKALGSDHLGCLFFVLPQTVLLLSALGYSFVLMKRWHTPCWLRGLVLLLYGLCPVFPMTALQEWKDTLYALLMLWFLILLLEAEPRAGRPTLALLSLVVCLSCCVRNDGKYIFLLVLVCLLLGRGHIFPDWKRVFACILLGAVLSIGVTRGLCRLYGIKPGPIREALSVPVQQTARYVKNHAEEITQDEWRTLDDVFASRELGEAYEPDRSDPVKALMAFHPSAEQLLAYAKVWAAQLCKHPGTYFSAAFGKIYGYVYLPHPEFYGMGYSPSNMKKGDRPIVLGNVLVTNPSSLEAQRAVCHSYQRLWTKFPILNLTYHPAAYFWVVLLAGTCLLRRKRYGKLFFLSPAAGVFLICCLSPLNASLRYALPLVYSAALLLALALRKDQHPECLPFERVPDVREQVQENTATP